MNVFKGRLLLVCFALTAAALYGCTSQGVSGDDRNHHAAENTPLIRQPDSAVLKKAGCLIVGPSDNITCPIAAPHKTQQ